MEVAETGGIPEERTTRWEQRSAWANELLSSPEAQREKPELFEQLARSAAAVESKGLLPTYE